MPDSGSKLSKSGSLLGKQSHFAIKIHKKNLLGNFIYDSPMLASANYCKTGKNELKINKIGKKLKCKQKNHKYTPFRKSCDQVLSSLSQLKRVLHLLSAPDISLFFIYFGGLYIVKFCEDHPFYTNSFLAKFCEISTEDF